MESTLNTVVANEADTIQPASPENGKGNKRNPRKTTGAPDYANMSSADLLSAWQAYVTDARSDIATLAINTVGADGASLVRGELAALVSVGLGLRKAYGRGVKRDVVAKLLPTVTIPQDFNPTFGLFLSAAKLRADDAAERKTATDIKSGLRSVIRSYRKNAK